MGVAGDRDGEAARVVEGAGVGLGREGCAVEVVGAAIAGGGGEGDVVAAPEPHLARGIGDGGGDCCRLCVQYGSQRHDAKERTEFSHIHPNQLPTLQPSSAQSWWRTGVLSGKGREGRLPVPSRHPRAAWLQMPHRSP